MTEQTGRTDIDRANEYHGIIDLELFIESGKFLNKPSELGLYLDRAVDECLRLEQPESAISALEKALSVGSGILPNDKKCDYLLKKADIYRQCGKPKDALKSVSEAMKIMSRPDIFDTAALACHEAAASIYGDMTSFSEIGCESEGYEQDAAEDLMKEGHGAMEIERNSYLASGLEAISRAIHLRKTLGLTSDFRYIENHIFRSTFYRELNQRNEARESLVTALRLNGKDGPFSYDISDCFAGLAEEEQEAHLKGED